MFFCEKPPGRDMADITRVIEQERVSPGLVNVWFQP